MNPQDFEDKLLKAEENIAWEVMENISRGRIQSRNPTTIHVWAPDYWDLLSEEAQERAIDTMRNLGWEFQYQDEDRWILRPPLLLAENTTEEES